MTEPRKTISIRSNGVMFVEEGHGLIVDYSQTEDTHFLFHGWIIVYPDTAWWNRARFAIVRRLYRELFAQAAKNRASSSEANERA
jgi:hypothetical protein